MKDYKFDSLNDKEFEALCISLLCKRENIFIERFKPGRDNGIDGRFYKDENSDAIVQCKHWIGSGLSSLLKYLKDCELKKVIKLNPSRYILSTSLPLSPSDKNKIALIFKPFIKKNSDILGKDDLNSLISQFPEVEKEHIKLWFSSPSLLEYLLNNATYNVSRESIKTITQKAKIYVNTASHKKALEKLDRLHTIIITGEPGIGKTTLAEQLCLHYLNQKYELICVDDSLREAENVYHEEKHQVFYFDDFLGSNYLEGLHSREDSKTTRFIKKVARLENKRFILTSRTSILNQGKQYSQAFRSDNIDRNEFELCIDSLTYFDKAQILYNHIWYGNLLESLVDEFYHERRYHEVIRHRNFNPRIIQFITDAEKINNPESSTYWPYIIKSLENPADIWDHAYTAQLDSLDRTLVDLVAFNGAPINETALNRAFDECIRHKGLARNHKSPSDFFSCAKLVCHSFINRQNNINADEVTYIPFNPSVTDYLLNRHSKSIHHLFEIIVSLNTLSSLYSLKSLYRRNFIDFTTYSHIVSKTYEFSTKRSIQDADYMVYMVSTMILEDIPAAFDHRHARKFIAKLMKSHYSNLDYLSHFLHILLHYIESNKVSKEFGKLCRSYINFLLTIELDHEAYSNLSLLITDSSIELNLELKDLHCNIINYWTEYITQYILEDGILAEFNDHEMKHEAYDALLTHLNSIFSEYSIHIDRSEIVKICDNVDLYDIIEENRSSLIKSDQISHRKNSDNYSYGQIDNLFERIK